DRLDRERVDPGTRCEAGEGVERAGDVGWRGAGRDADDADSAVRGFMVAGCARAREILAGTGMVDAGFVEQQAGGAQAGRTAIHRVVVRPSDRAEAQIAEV